MNKLISPLQYLRTWQPTGNVQAVQGTFERMRATDCQLQQMMVGADDCETLSGASVANLDSSVTYLTAPNGSYTVTLPDPTTVNSELDKVVGLVKTFLVVAAPVGPGATITVTPTTPGAVANVEFTELGQGATYVWTPSGWCLSGGGGTFTIPMPIVGTEYELQLSDAFSNGITPSIPASAANGVFLILQGQSSTTGNGAEVDVIAGNTTSGTGGVVTVSAGFSVNGNGGAANMNGGFSSTGTGGFTTVSGGNSVSGTGGEANLVGGNTTNGTSGAVLVAAGNTVNGNGGFANLLGGTTTNGNGGQTSIAGGFTATGIGGPVVIQGGNVTVSGPGGNVAVDGGTAQTGGSGGSVSLNGGSNLVAGDGGSIFMFAGSAQVGNGGNVTINPGNVIAGNAGDVPGSLHLVCAANFAAGATHNQSGEVIVDASNGGTAHLVASQQARPIGTAVGSSDMAGVISAIAPSGSVSITFGSAYGSNGATQVPVVMVCNQNPAAGATLPVYVTGVSATGFTVHNPNAGVGQTVDAVYFVVGTTFVT